MYMPRKGTFDWVDFIKRIAVIAIPVALQNLLTTTGSMIDTIMIAPLEYVNAPQTISKIDNMVSINNCIAVDLYGQISSESAGKRHISGTGGQLDYLTGAAMSRGGKAFICMHSAHRAKDGTLHSCVQPNFCGDIITSPRSQAYFMATEYGVVNLTGSTTWERAEKLISIAHPDFRDDLIREAQAQNIWRQSNKR